MASGIATSQGWTIPMVAGMDNVPVQDDTFLFNQLSLTSTTGPIAGQNQTNATVTAFGKKHTSVRSELKCVNKTIHYLSSLKK